MFAAIRSRTTAAAPGRRRRAQPAHLEAVFEIPQMARACDEEHRAAKSERVPHHEMGSRPSSNFIEPAQQQMQRTADNEAYMRRFPRIAGRAL